MSLKALTACLVGAQRCTALLPLLGAGARGFGLRSRHRQAEASAAPGYL